MGIQAAIDKYFQGARWQRCKVHFMRELINKASWKDQRELIKDLKSIYACDDRDRCLEVAEQVAVKWEYKAPKIVSALRKGVKSTLTVCDLPSSMRRKLNSPTNMIERLMKKLKKRTRKVRPSWNDILRGILQRFFTPL
jgi:putative transposase